MSKIKQYIFEKAPEVSVRPIRSEVRFGFLEDGNHTVSFLGDGRRVWVQIQKGKMVQAGLELPNGGNVHLEKAASYFFPPEKNAENWFRTETWISKGLRLVVESEVMYDGEDPSNQTFEPFTVTLLVTNYGEFEA